MQVVSSRRCIGLCGANSRIPSSPTLSYEDLTELVSNPRTSAAKVTNMATTSWTNSITSLLRWRSDKNGRTSKPSALQPSRATRTTAASNRAMTSRQVRYEERSLQAAFCSIRGGGEERYRLFPVRRDDSVVVAEDQIEPIRIVRDSSDAARRHD